MQISRGRSDRHIPLFWAIPIVAAALLFVGQAPAAWVDVGKSYQAFYMAAAPHVNKVYFFERNQKKLYVSSDNGTTWTGVRAQVTNGTVFDAGLMKIIFDPADTTDNTFWAGGIYGSAGIFHTTDGAQTFTALCFNYTETFSVDLTDPQRKTILATDHGAGLFLSTDGGATCRPILNGLKAADTAVSGAAEPWVIDSQTFLVGAHGALWRSTDVAATWKKVDTHVPVQPLLVDPSNGAFVYLLTWNQGLIRSTDKGLTWALIAPHVTLHSAAESNAGTFVGDSLVFIKMVLTTAASGQLAMSTDYTQYNNFLDPFPTTGNNLADQNYGVIYSKPGNMLYTYTRYGKISRWDLSTSVRPAARNPAHDNRTQGVNRVVGTAALSRAVGTESAEIYDIRGARVSAGSGSVNHGVQGVFMVLGAR